MWIDSNELVTPTVGVADYWQPLSEEVSAPASLVFADDNDRPRDSLAIIHESLRSSTQLSEQEEKNHFIWLGDLVQALVQWLLQDPASRQCLLIYLRSVASGKTPLDRGLATVQHRLLMTDIKHIIESLGGKQQVADFALRLEQHGEDDTKSLNSVWLAEIQQIDWPHQLVLAIAQLPFAINQPGQCSTYLRAFSNYLAVIPGASVVKKNGLASESLLSLIENYYLCRNYLVHHNLRLVYHVAKKHSLSPGEIPDIFQEGIFGLVRAIEKFQPQSGFRFSTYAYNWIDAKTRLAPVRHKGFMRLPTSTLADLKVLRSTANTLQSQGRNVNPINVAACSDLSESRVKTLLELNNYALSIDQPLQDQEQELTLTGVLADEGHTVEDRAWQIELTEVVDQLLTTLTDREAFILIHRFGLKGIPSQSLELISSNVGLSRERVRQIEKKILAQLRELAESRQIDF